MIMKDIYGELVAIQHHRGSHRSRYRPAGTHDIAQSASRRRGDELAQEIVIHLDRSEFSRLYRCLSAAPYQRRKLTTCKDPVKRKGGEHLCLTGFLKASSPGSAALCQT